MTIRYLVAAVALLMGGSAYAADGCTSINAAPTTITASGNYCLATNVTASQGIYINANDVTLDCGGHVINGMSVNTDSAAIGIFASNKNNVTVKNCTVKGYAEGIVVTGFGNVVANNLVMGSLARGVRVAGENNLLHDNRISDIGGSTSMGFTVFAGIMATGTTDIRWNTASGIQSRTSSGKGAFGIYSLQNDAGSMSNNTVRNLIGDGSGINMGITAHNSINAVMINNQVSNPSSTYGYAFYCTGSGSIAKGNIAQGYAYGTSPICVDGGGNVSP